VNELAVSTALPADRNPAAVYLARLRAGSRRAQRSALEALAVELSDGRLDALHLPWHLLGYQHVAAIRARMVERYAPRTVNRHLSALRGVATEAFRLGLMNAEQRERVLSIESVKLSGKLAGRSVNAADIGAVLAAAGPRDAAILALLYGAGLRRTEATSIDLADVDVETGRLEVRNGKGGKARTTAVPAAALDVLRAWVAVRGSWSGPLLTAYERGFASRAGIRPSTIYDAVRRVIGRARVAGFTPHDLRRTWVSDLLDAGADLVSVQRLAGHADPRTTAGYDRRDEASRMAAAARLPFPRPREAVPPQK
jgi:integrase